MAIPTSLRPRIAALVIGFAVIAAACGGGETTVAGDVAASGADVATSDAPVDDADSGESESGGARTTVAPTESTEPPAAEEAPVAEAIDYPSFSLQTIGGEPFELIDHAGSDVVLWFWAPW